jgi:hypothetical protein
MPQPELSVPSRLITSAIPCASGLRKEPGEVSITMVRGGAIRPVIPDVYVRRLPQSLVFAVHVRAWITRWATLHLTFRDADHAEAPWAQHNVKPIRWPIPPSLDGSIWRAERAQTVVLPAVVLPEPRRFYVRVEVQQEGGDEAVVDWVDLPVEVSASERLDPKHLGAGQSPVSRRGSRGQSFTCPGNPPASSVKCLRGAPLGSAIRRNWAPSNGIPARPGGQVGPSVERIASRSTGAAEWVGDDQTGARRAAIHTACGEISPAGDLDRAETRVAGTPPSWTPRWRRWAVRSRGPRT